MSDDQLLLISEAERPCASRLISDCYFSDNYVRRVAAAERRARADKREQETKDRANEIAKKSAEAAKKSAEAAELSAKSAGDTAFYSGWAALAGFTTAVFAGLTFLDRRTGW